MATITNHFGVNNSGVQVNSSLFEGSITVNQAPEVSYGEIARWLSPVDPWTNHTTARRQHQPGTGEWLLQDVRYKAWKEGTGHIWLHGKPGCGKTVLCSTVIEDLKKHDGNVGLAIYYFSFSDAGKQDYYGLLKSLVAQLSSREPAISALRRLREQGRHTIVELERQLALSLETYPITFVAIDALDECPEGSRSELLVALDRLMRWKTRLFMTSRELGDIQVLLDQAVRISAASSLVDADIHLWLRLQIAEDKRLVRLSADLKAKVEQSISSRADGMFRWAYLQLDEVKKLKNLRPSAVQRMLEFLPPTLDHTYDRILSHIEHEYRDHAITLLRWLMYATRPLTLNELREVVLIERDPPAVNFWDRGDIDDTIHILAGLIVVEEPDNQSGPRKLMRMLLDTELATSMASVATRINLCWFCSTDDDTATMSPAQSTEDIRRRCKCRANSDTCKHGQNMPDILVADHLSGLRTVRLAHFSVQEYLLSARMSADNQAFRLESASSHLRLASACITYLLNYVCMGFGVQVELEIFPLLRYALRFWYHHSALHGSSDVSSEIRLLESTNTLQAWPTSHKCYCSAVKEDKSNMASIDVHTEPHPSHWYYASKYDLVTVLEVLLQRRPNLDANNCFRNALRSAAERGSHKIVMALLGKKSDVKSFDEACCWALDRASCKGHLDIIRILLDVGTDATMGLYSAAGHGQIAVVRLLLERGADPDEGMALAVGKGHADIIDVLLGYGADPARGLRSAVRADRWDIAQLLCECDTAAAHITQANGQRAQKGRARLWEALQSFALNITQRPELREEYMNDLRNRLDGNAAYYRHWLAIPLYTAIKLDDIGLAKLLLEEGALVEEKMINKAEFKEAGEMKALLENHAARQYEDLGDNGEGSDTSSFHN